VPATSLAPGDVFEVRVFQEPDVSGAHRLGPDGTIDFPLCGKVPLAGLSANVAAEALAACLRGRFFKNPQVSVFVREQSSRRIFVFGEVQKPGTYPFEEGMSVVQALALAGGFTRIASRNSCQLTRLQAGVESRQQLRLEDIVAGRAPSVRVQPGDVIYVPESMF
jgi:polysaccharide export outer membrane protein